MTVTKRNLEVFNNGITKAMSIMKPRFIEFGDDVARELVAIAADSYYDEQASLTGNLINSIAGGVYYNKVLERVITVSKAAGYPAETHTYTFVGDGVFKDYDTGDTVYFVFQYSGPSLRFQKVDGTGKGKQSAMDFFSSYIPQTSMLEVVICAAAPYAEYLQKKRNLDVLTTAKSESEKVWVGNYVHIVKL